METDPLELFFNGKIGAEALKEGLFINDDSVEGDFIITSDQLIKLCDAVIHNYIEPKKLDFIAFTLIGSIYYSWDGGTIDGEKVGRTIFEWNNPDINYHLTIENIKLWKLYLQTGEHQLK